jgi:hypothetical protein
MEKLGDQGFLFMQFNDICISSPQCMPEDHKSALIIIDLYDKMHNLQATKLITQVT